MACQLWFLLYCVVVAGGYKPVVIVHGIFDNANSMEDMKQFILSAHPGTDVSLISLFNDGDSVKPMWEQVAGFGDAIRDVMKKSPDGIHLLCFSQGGLACRGMLQNTPNHTVDTFLSLSSPQMGQFGDTTFFPFLKHLLREELYKIFYTPFGQNLSVGNYWNDPFHHDLYLQHNVFLPLLNNEINSSYSAGNKTGIVRLKKLVAIGGPDDGVITPWQSSHFAFYKIGSGTEIVETRQQEDYLSDAIGLKTLDERGDFIVYNISGVHHIHWHGNKTVFDCCIKQWLT